MSSKIVFKGSSEVLLRKKDTSTLFLAEFVINLYKVHKNCMFNPG